MHRQLRLLTFVAVLSSAASAGAATYSVQKWIPLTPLATGAATDFVTFDAAKRRVYVAEGTLVAVVDPDQGSQVASLTGTQFSKIHGTALNSDSTFAFVSAAGGNLALKVDLVTKAVVASAPTGIKPDHILYDAFSNKLLTMNNGAASATVIDPATMAVVKTIAFSAGTTPEVSVSDGKGQIFVNLPGTPTSKIGVINATDWTSTEWPLPAGCTAPTGIAMDLVGRRLFSSCSGALAITNADTGAAVGTLIPTGAGADGAAYDPVNKLVFTTNGGSGTLTVVTQTDADHYAVLENAPTASGCKTNAFDPATHVIYSVCNSGTVLSLALIGTAGSADGGAPITDGATAGDGPTADAPTASVGDATGADDAAGAGGSGGDAAGTAPAAERSGCSCTVGANSRAGGGLAGLVLSLSIALARRKRHASP